MGWRQLLDGRLLDGRLLDGRLLDGRLLESLLQGDGVCGCWVWIKSPGYEFRVGLCWFGCFGFGCLVCGGLGGFGSFEPLGGSRTLCIVQAAPVVPFGVPTIVH